MLIATTVFTEPHPEAERNAVTAMLTLLLGSKPYPAGVRRQELSSKRGPHGQYLARRWWEPKEPKVDRTELTLVRYPKLLH